MLMKSREDFRGLERRHVEKATPDFGTRESAGRETCDNAKVVGAAVQGVKEVGIEQGRCSGD